MFHFCETLLVLKTKMQSFNCQPCKMLTSISLSFSFVCIRPFSFHPVAGLLPPPHRGRLTDLSGIVHTTSKTKKTLRKYTFVEYIPPHCIHIWEISPISFLSWHFLVNLGKYFFHCGVRRFYFRNWSKEAKSRTSLKM